MSLEERDAAYLWDIVQAAEKTARAVRGKSLRDYLADEDLRLIVERRLEIMGEAARRVSEGFRGEHGDIPWKSMIGQRNVMAHEYDEIDHERVWNVVMAGLPRLVRLLKPLVPPAPEEKG
ncbi:MAG: HepT-like ribonuclease domain-containing protein [Planctomycetota bacterium]